MKLTLALIQLTSGADMAANIEKLRHFVANAAGRGAKLIATPENTFLMEAPGPARQFYTEGEHPGVRAACALAKQHGVWLLVGSVAVVSSLRAEGEAIQENKNWIASSATLPHNDDQKAYNRSLLIAPDGTIAARYDKIHLFDVEVGDGQIYKESAKIIPGDRAVVADMAGTKLGLSICYDLRFPQLYRALAKAGARILTVPAAFTQTTGEAHWHVLLRARAIENGCFVIAPAQCGTHPGTRKTFGHSLVVGPWGEVITDGGAQEGVTMAEIDLAEVEKARKRIPSLEHDRDFVIPAEAGI